MTNLKTIAHPRHQITFLTIKLPKIVFWSEVERRKNIQSNFSTFIAASLLAILKNKGSAFIV